MGRTYLALLVLLIAMPALAQEPVGCDKFKWPLDHERTLLANPSPVASGGEMEKSLEVAVVVSLVPFADAHLPMAPSRAPKSPETYAGFLRASALPKSGTYRVTLSEGAWIDLFQGGHEVKSGAFSGATGCDGIRKSVKFELTTEPFIIEVSGTKARSIAIVVTPD